MRSTKRFSTTLRTRFRASKKNASWTAIEAGFVDRVLFASDETEALEVARKRESPIDLIISHVVMPSLGGPELVRQLREIRPDIRVISMSGYAGK